MRFSFRICRRRFGPARRAGFTLIEIMVVVGILAIVLAMGLPPFVRSMQKDSLRQAAGDIEEACSTARAHAILQGVPTEVVIRATDGQVAVVPVPDMKGNPIGAGSEAGEQPAGAGAAKPAVFSARLREDVAVTLLYVNLKNQMDAEESHVHFYPNGTSDEFTIVLQTGRGVRKISLECVTGLARVEVIK
jgi:prepilin-type N-terminal cleavage/methylation domain-containing protein